MARFDRRTKTALWITMAVCAYIFGTAWLCTHVSPWFALLILAPVVFVIVLYLVAWIEIESNRNKPDNK